MITAAEEITSSSLSITNDPDQDGLSNEDELKYGSDPSNPDTDGDGYNDGAEVRSGYDPTIPAPGDKLDTEETVVTTSAESIDLTSSDENLTENLSNQIAEMLVNQSEGEGISLNTINELIENSVTSKITYDDLPEIDESTIKVLAQNYSEFSEEKQERKKKEDNEAYLSAIFYIMANNLPHSINSAEDISDFSEEITERIPSILYSSENMEYFNDLADRGSEILKKMNDIEVPQDMLDTHKEGLQLATYAISLKDQININSEDPISSMIGLSKVEHLFTLASEYMTRLEDKFEELDLTDFIVE